MLRKIQILLLLILVSFLISAWLMPRMFGLEAYLDFAAPKLEVTLLKSPAMQIEISGSDALSGINVLEIKTRKNGEDKTIYQYQFEGAEQNFNIKLPLSKLDLKEGVNELDIYLQDRSFWKRQSNKELTINVDRTPPMLEILSQQHRMFGGGAELILYRTSDPELYRSGVELDGNFFLGQPLNKILPEKNVPDDVYISLFAAAIELRATDFAPLLISEDSYGNSSKIPLIFTFTERNIPQGSPNLSDRFLNNKIPPLVNEASRLYPEHFKPFPSGTLSEDEWITQFRIVNEDFRKLLRADLELLLRDRSSLRFINKPFIRPMGGSLMSGFGEYRSYKYNGKDAGQSVHEGFDIASVKHDNVVSPAAGEVLFAKQYGIYGGSVLIDHGLGLSSLSGHLSSIAVKEGDIVEAGTLIGRSGETGLAGGDHLHFEIRVGFVPVTPIEWWDNLWFRDDISGKIDGVVQSFAKNDDIKEGQSS